jgi:hypothetical protein
MSQMILESGPSVGGDQNAAKNSVDLLPKLRKKWIQLERPNQLLSKSNNAIKREITVEMVSSFDEFVRIASQTAENANFINR